MSTTVTPGQQHNFTVTFGMIATIELSLYGSATLWEEQESSGFGQPILIAELAPGSITTWGPYVGDNKLRLENGGGNANVLLSKVPSSKWLALSDDSVNLDDVYEFTSRAQTLPRSILTVGGDHPYAQWWGNDGTDGMAQMYLDLGIQPYIAICADENESEDSTSGHGATLGQSGMMTIEQAQELERRGVEFVSHFARHSHFIELSNTGIRIWYTGAEASPTVQVTTTNVTCTTATTGATNFALATYTTLSALRIAIKALPGWNCAIATELKGTEPSKWLLPMSAARSVTTIGSGDPTNSNQRFAICAGLMLRYTGNAYRKFSVANEFNFILLFGDGARLAAVSTNNTLATIASTINALNITGLTVLLMDNGYNSQTINGSNTLNPGQKIRETYCWGDELGTSLGKMKQTRDANQIGVWITGGCGIDYALLRQAQSVKEYAASKYGLTIKAFAQPGGRLWPWMLRVIEGEHVSWRGNLEFPLSRSLQAPRAMPVNANKRFTGHFTAFGPDGSTPYSEEAIKAVFDALADQPGWHVDMLNHMVTPTPGDPSPYTGLDQHNPAYYTSSANQDEGPFYRELVHAAALRDAGLIDILPPSKAAAVRAVMAGPTNLVFNSRFRAKSASFIAADSTHLPGWFLIVSGTDFSVFDVDDEGIVTITTNGAITSDKVPIQAHVVLQRGKTYELGFLLDATDWGGTNFVRMAFYTMDNSMEMLGAFGSQSLITESVTAGTQQVLSTVLTVPVSPGPQPAQFITKAGPFSFTSGDAISIKLDNKTASQPIVLTGLTTAGQIADAINAQFAVDAAYVGAAQYRTPATVVDNRVVITSPRVLGVDDTSYSEITNSTGTPLAALFGTGVTGARATSSYSHPRSTMDVGFRFGPILSSTSATQTIKISRPFCREI